MLSPSTTVHADNIPQDTPIAIGTTHLDDVGDYWIKASYTDGTSVQYPYGWVGEADPYTGLSCTPYGMRAGKRAFLMQPPWRGKQGSVVQQFRLKLPRAASIVLRFGIAMRRGGDDAGDSNAASYHVSVNGKPILDHLKADTAWKEWRSDLTDYAGQTVSLTFKVDPASPNTASFDQALWIDRRVIVASDATADEASPPSPLPLLDLAKAARIWDGCAPTQSEQTDFNSMGFMSAGDSAAFISGLAAKMPQGSLLNVASGAHIVFVKPDGELISSDDPAVSNAIIANDANGTGKKLTVRYRFIGRMVRLTWSLSWLPGGCARVNVTSPDPFIAAVDFGTIGPVTFRRMVHIPYYGPVWYLTDHRLFANSYLDYTQSNASEIAGMTAIYRPMTNGTRNSVNETAYYALSPRLADVLPTPPNAPSPYRGEMGRRLVYDVSSTASFVETAAYLRDIASYGLTGFAVIVHQWQTSGFDNAYPDVLPANADQGGDQGVREIASAARDMDSLFALHENYEDFYENAKSFRMSDVAIGADGKPLLSRKTRAQSYACKPGAILRYAAPITKAINSQLHTSAGFLDVSPSVEPWFHVDYDAADNGAAKFSTGYSTRSALYAAVRSLQEGPVYGEGNAHWFSSGLLDGVDAESEYRAHDEEYGADTPLLVDFDLLKIHPLQLNYGMGYFSRWVTPLGEPDGTASPSERDRYRMQEIAFGHAAYVTPELTRDLPFVWQEANLVPPVASEYATANVQSISYEANGQMISTDAAIAANVPFDRVHIVYDNGLQIWANSRAEPWTLTDQAITLPQNGWLAVGHDLTAYTALREGRMVDYCETPTRIFAGTRSDPTTGPPDGVVNYGKVATDGSFTLTRLRAGEWSLIAVPRANAITIRLNAAAIDPSLSAIKVEAYDVTGKDVGAVAVSALPGGWFQLTANTIPGAVRYTVSARPATSLP